VLLHGDDEIDPVDIKDKHVLDKLVEAFSDQRKKFGFVLGEQDEEMTYSDYNSGSEEDKHSIVRVEC
jgi:hypothetical protein